MAKLVLPVDTVNTCDVWEAFGIIEARHGKIPNRCSIKEWRKRQALPLEKGDKMTVDHKLWSQQHKSWKIAVSRGLQATAHGSGVPRCCL